MSDDMQTFGPDPQALDYQARILPEVSRTFALTIPTLPQRLRVSVANAYLLCRIADTIEDDAGLDCRAKRVWGDRFIAAVRGEIRASDFARELAPLLSHSALAAERELVAQCDQVLAITHALPPAERSALQRCVTLMSAGMQRYQGHAGLPGLPDMRALDEYCYYVAGVVGEMLTELFCEHAPEIAQRRERLTELAPSFGQGLQMTNILKDIWDDRRRGACWLPRAEFGLDPNGQEDLIDALEPVEFRARLESLVIVAHGHLRNALDYTLLIPPRFRGIRRFCLWALGMAVPTLDRIYHNSDFSDGREVKISRREVRGIVRKYGFFAGQDWIVRSLFRRASAGLPQSDPGVREGLDAVVRAAVSRFEGGRSGGLDDHSLSTGQHF